MQQLNYNTSSSLQAASRLGTRYSKFLTAADGEAIATEITNRLANYADAENKQMYCDARKWMNQEVNDHGRVGYGPNRITGITEQDDKYKLIVEYNTTGARDEKHFWNLFMAVRLKDRHGGGLEKAQIAHLTMYSEVDYPDRRRPVHTFTKLGAFHLKENLAIGRLTGAGAIDPRYHHQHAAGIIPAIPARAATSTRPAVPGRAASIQESYRRYFIRTVNVAPAVAAVPADPARGIAAVAAVPAQDSHEIGLQEQKGNISRMTAHFGRIAIQVLQEYLDAGYSTAGFATAANPTNFKAQDYCKAGAGAYSAAADIGSTTDIAEPSGATARAAARAAAIASGLNATRPANLRTIAAREDAAEAAARLTALRALPPTGGKRKTRRSTKKRRTTRRR